MLLFLLSGPLLLRFAERQLFALLFQLPPRITRFEPSEAALGHFLSFFPAAVNPFVGGCQWRETCRYGCGQTCRGHPCTPMKNTTAAVRQP